MTFEPLLAASLSVQAHLGAAAAAAVLTPLQLVSRRGSHLHRAIGRLWFAAMFAAALTSFAIPSRAPIAGSFGVIHLLSLITVVAVPRAYFSARAHRPGAHRFAALSLVAGLVIAGGFAVASPGRIAHQILFARVAGP